MAQIETTYIFIEKSTGLYQEIASVTYLGQVVEIPGGEANTVSNIGLAGVGPYYTKVGVDLRFKNTAPGSNVVTVIENLSNKTNEINLNPAALSEKLTPTNDYWVILQDIVTGNFYKTKPTAFPTGAGGQANTASNVGSVGTGVFKQKTGVDLELYKLYSTNNLLTIALNGTDRIDFTIVESNISITASQVSDFDTEVSNNTNVALNTTHRGLSNNPHVVTLEQARTANNQLSGDIDFNDNNIDNVGYIDFDLSAIVANAEGRLKWNSDDGTLEIRLPGGNVVLQIGQEILIRCKNASGSGMSNGDVVYISGATGNKPNITLADADNIATSGVIGVLTEDIANGNNGYVNAFGLVRDLDTSTFSAGQLLWLSQTAGEFTATRPTPPAISVVVGICVVSHATEGIIIVKTQNVARLVGLSDVIISGQSDEDYIYWDNAASVWKARSFNIQVSANSDVAANTTHRGLTNNPHTVTKTQVGLSNVDNTSDVDKPVSSLTQTALDGKAPSLGADDNYVTDAEKVVIGNTSGSNTGDQIISDATITTTDITTNNVSITKHGFAPKLPNNANLFFNGIGGYTAPAGGGDVVKVGTPVNNQIGVWTGDGTLEGDSDLTFDGLNLTVTGNIVVGGTVDGIDVAVDVAANTTHRGLTNNPHTVTKTQVGLSNADNTSDADKPVSTATQTALDATVKDTGNESIDGIKTFTSFPVTPSSAPTTDYQTANKKFVDDKAFTHRTEHTWAIKGEITAVTYPGMFVDIATGETAKTVQMRYKIKSGTSVLLTLIKNGTDVTSPDYDQVTCNTTVAEVTGDITLSNNDVLELKAETATGTPTDLICTIVIEKTKDLNA